MGRIAIMGSFGVDIAALGRYNPQWMKPKR